MKRQNSARASAASNFDCFAINRDIHRLGCFLKIRSANQDSIIQSQSGDNGSRLPGNIEDDRPSFGQKFRVLLGLCVQLMDKPYFLCGFLPPAPKKECHFGASFSAAHRPSVSLNKLIAIQVPAKALTHLRGNVCIITPPVIRSIQDLKRPNDHLLTLAFFSLYHNRIFS